MTTRVLREALLMDKTADRMATNDGRMPKEVELRKDPPGGEDPHPPDKPSAKAWYEFLEGKPHLIDRAFDTFKDAKKTEQALLSENFNTKDYEARRVLLQKTAGFIPDGSTLSERVNALK